MAYDPTTVRNTLLGLLIIGVFYLCARLAAAQDKKASPDFAEIASAPSQTLVVVRDPRGADQMIVSTFYWAKVQGLDKPIMRSMTDVLPVVKDVAVAAQGPANPAEVVKVHVSLVKIISRMEWDAPTDTPAK